MVALPVYDKSGAEVAKYEIDPATIAPSVNKQLLHDVVVMYQANLRLGTHRTRSRGEVVGTRKKLYRQKGTGNARAGHRSSGVRRGGGHIFARRPRDYSYRLPRKALRAATRMAVASRIADDEITLIDGLQFSEPKTRDMAAILKALKLDGQRTLLVAVESHDVNIYKSIRNIAGVTVCPVMDLNALTVLKPQRLLMTTAALDVFRASVAATATGSGDAGESEAE